MAGLKPLPEPGELNFDKKTRSAFAQWKAYIESLVVSSGGDPLEQPIVSAIVPGTGITVDNTNPQYPVVKFNTATRVSAYGSTDQSLAAGVTTKVLFDTEEKDSLGEFSSSRFTANNTGRYWVSVNVLLHCPAAETGYRLGLFKNGAELRRLDHKRITYAGDETISGCADIDVVAGDYIEIYVYASAATTTVSGSLHTFMTIARTL